MFITACVLGAALTAARLGAPWQSVAFVVLGLSQLGVALAVRAPRRRGGPGNPALLAAVAVSAVLQVGAVLWTPLRALLTTEPLSASQLAWCAAVAALPGTALAATRLASRSSGRRSGNGGTSGPDTPDPAGTRLEPTEEVAPR